MNGERNSNGERSRCQKTEFFWQRQENKPKDQYKKEEKKKTVVSRLR